MQCSTKSNIMNYVFLQPRRTVEKSVDEQIFEKLTGQRTKDTDSTGKPGRTSITNRNSGSLRSQNQTPNNKANATTFTCHEKALPVEPAHSKITTRAPPSFTSSDQRIEDAELRKRRAPLNRRAKMELLWEEETDLAKLEEEKGTTSFNLSPPGASIFRVQGYLLVATGFLTHFVTAKDSQSGTDRGVKAYPSGPSG